MERVGEYVVNTGDTDIPTLRLFPFVFIQSFDNRHLASLIGKTIATQADLDNDLIKSISRLTEILERDDEDAGASAAVAVPDPMAGSPSTTASTRHDARNLEATELLEKVFRSDIAGYMLFSQLAAFQQLQQLGDKCTAHLVSAEKRGNVLYCNFHIVIFDAGTNTPIYWDREVFFVSGTNRSYLICTSAPSTDRRPASSVWITSWLSSLRMPLE
jgi:hypothetical protein